MRQVFACEFNARISHHPVMGWTGCWYLSSHKGTDWQTKDSPPAKFHPHSARCNIWWQMLRPLLEYWLLIRLWLEREKRKCTGHFILNDGNRCMSADPDMQWLIVRNQSVLLLAVSFVPMDLRWISLFPLSSIASRSTMPQSTMLPFSWAFAGWWLLFFIPMIRPKSRTCGQEEADVWSRSQSRHIYKHKDGAKALVTVSQSRGLYSWYPSMSRASLRPDGRQSVIEEDVKRRDTRREGREEKQVSDERMITVWLLLLFLPFLWFNSREAATLVPESRYDGKSWCRVTIILSFFSSSLATRIRLGLVSGSTLLSSSQYAGRCDGRQGEKGRRNAADTEEPHPETTGETETG